MVEVKAVWKGGMKFEGSNENGINVEMSNDGSAPAPMELMLIALGGCTGMDVVSILEKMRVKFEELEIEIKGERSEEHPKVYKSIEITYKIKGDVEEDKVKKAVDLSLERYCSVGAMLKRSADIKYRIDLTG
jgi:putative redox protein